ncbi:MAG: peptidase M23 [Geobacteraceae bacterium GWC2_58_44]|nr:MAG: peptidase M23 [Geobacteraceae bacterium GWC2_58_44]
MKRTFFAIIILLILPASALADLDLPVENGVVTSGVGWRVDPFGSGKLNFHRGIDIAVPVGTPVRATRRGRIVFAGARRGYGATVIVEHGNGDRTLYGHNSIVRVGTGDLVEPGTVVALSGNTGRSTGPHVHFEQIPSGRPVVEEAATAEAGKPETAQLSDQRYLLEQKMEQSLNSILKTLRSGATGQGG